MKVIQATKIDKEIIENAIRVLKRGGVVIFPTDTSYGISCDPASQKAVNKIFKIKNRPKSEPVLLVAASRRMVEKYALIKNQASRLAGKYWPGPLTLLLPKEPGIRFSSGIVSHDMIAFRVPEYKPLLQLVRKFKKPIVSTSANIAGQKPIYDGNMLVYEFASGRVRPDLIVNIGKLPKNPPSAVVAIENGKKIIVRRGKLKI